MVRSGRSQRLQVIKQTLKDDILSKATQIMPPGYRQSSRLSAVADASLGVASATRRFFWVEEGGDTSVQSWLSAHGHGHDDLHPLFVQQIARRVISRVQSEVHFPTSVDNYIRLLSEFESSDTWSSLHDPRRVLTATVVAQAPLTSRLIEYNKVCEDLVPVLVEEQKERGIARKAKDQARALWVREKQLKKNGRSKAQKAYHKAKPQIDSTNIDSDDEEIVTDLAEELTYQKDLTYNGRVNNRMGHIRSKGDIQEAIVARKQHKLAFRQERSERKRRDDHLSSLMANVGTTDEAMDTEP